MNVDIYSFGNLWAYFGFVVFVLLLGWLITTLGKQRHRWVVPARLGLILMWLPILVALLALIYRRSGAFGYLYIGELIVAFLFLLIYMANFVAILLPKKGEKSRSDWWEGALSEIILFVVFLVIWIIGLIVFTF